MTDKSPAQIASEARALARKAAYAAKANKKPSKISGKASAIVLAPKAKAPKKAAAAGLIIPATPVLSLAEIKATIASAREDKGLNWEIETARLAMVIDDRSVLVPNQKAIRRGDEWLTTASDNWHECANSIFFDFVADFIRASNGAIDLATLRMGSFRNGAIIWAQAQIKDGFTLFRGKDEVLPFFLWTLPHEYGRSIDFRITATRIACLNTLMLALKGEADGGIKVNHWSKFDPDRVKSALLASHDKMQQYKEIAEFLAAKSYDDNMVEHYFRQVFPASDSKRDADPLALSRPAQTCMDVLETQPGAEFGAGTWWQAYNAVTYAIDHKLGQGEETRTMSAWYGANRKRKALALEEALVMANQ